MTTVDALLEPVFTKKISNHFFCLGETYSVAPNDNHKFCYMKDMTPDEVMLIKCFDSRSQGQPSGKEGIAGWAPHTAFEDPETPADAEKRQSIEVRCLVFYNE